MYFLVYTCSWKSFEVFLRFSDSWVWRGWRPGQGDILVWFFFAPVYLSPLLICRYKRKANNIYADMHILRLHSRPLMQTGSEIIKDLLDLGILVTWAVWMLQWKCNTHQSAAVKYQQLQTDCWLAGQIDTNWSFPPTSAVPLGMAVMHFHAKHST